MWPLIEYVFYNPQFLWGMILDLLVLPLALVMFCIKWMYPKPLDVFYPRYSHAPPILLVHGSGANEAQWVFAPWYLKGRFNVYTVQLNELPASPKTSIKSLAEIVDQKVQQIYQDTGQPITLVGHSMGGLVSAWYAEEFPHTEIYLKQVITIASPWRGAPALQHLNLGTVRHSEMTPGSIFLQQLSERMRRPRHLYTCFGSPYDFQVPREYTCVNHTKVTSKTYPWGHTSAIVMPTIWWFIRTISQA